MLPYPFPDLIVKEFELRIYLVALFLYRVEYPQVEHIEHVVFHHRLAPKEFSTEY